MVKLQIIPPTLNINRYHCLVVNIVVNYCCKLKMVKESETGETKGFFVTFLSLVTFQLGAGPLATPICQEFCFRNEKAFSNL